MKNKTPLQFLRKGFILIFCFTLFSNVHLFAQAGAKWATGGNSSATGDFLGTTNSFPLIFKINNAQKMQLTTGGVLQINNLSGTGNRLLQTDASGNISPFTMGTSTQVLYGNGTWGALPTSSNWSTTGNVAGTNDFIGTTNNQMLNFKVNNTKWMSLSATGEFNLVTCAGTGNRIAFFNSFGKLSFLPSGTVTQYLAGDGSWQNIPTSPASVWNTSGTNVYYNGGNVGIGTSTPFTALDVVGDARISNNLYVGGGIIITDKVNANTQVTTSRMVADSIVTDSTKGFYGTSKFNGAVKLQNWLDVTGNSVFTGTTTINGAFKTMSNITFAGDKSLGYYPPTATTPEMFVIDKLGPLPVLPPDCGTVVGATGTINLFHNEIKCWGFSSGVGAVNVVTMGYDGVNGVIDVAGDNGHGHIGPDLLMNNTCGKNIYMCTGPLGGFVATGSV